MLDRAGLKRPGRGLVDFEVISRQPLWRSAPPRCSLVGLCQSKSLRWLAKPVRGSVPISHRKAAPRVAAAASNSNGAIHTWARCACSSNYLAVKASDGASQALARRRLWLTLCEPAGSETRPLMGRRLLPRILCADL